AWWFAVAWWCWFTEEERGTEWWFTEEERGTEWWLVVALGCSGALTVRIPLSLSLSLTCTVINAAFKGHN
ncbi:hypothetical protein P7M70_24130, partial [Vibrio parahaemolyticus]|nr:hypothetical protein [Vibrio parahaemolyticus]